MSKVEDSLYVRGQILGARFENVTTFPTSPEAGRMVFYVPTSTMYWFSGTQWLKATGGGAGSYYYIASDKVVTVGDGEVMYLPMNLDLQGIIALDGAISDSPGS